MLYLARSKGNTFHSYLHTISSERSTLCVLGLKLVLFFGKSRWHNPNCARIFILHPLLMLILPWKHSWTLTRPCPVDFEISFESKLSWFLTGWSNQACRPWIPIHHLSIELATHPSSLTPCLNNLVNLVDDSNGLVLYLESKYCWTNLIRQIAYLNCH
jgi:hypothetical protein